MTAAAYSVDDGWTGEFDAFDMSPIVDDIVVDDDDEIMAAVATRSNSTVVGLSSRVQSPRAACEKERAAEAMLSLTGVQEDMQEDATLTTAHAVHRIRKRKASKQLRACRSAETSSSSSGSSDDESDAEELVPVTVADGDGPHRDVASVDDLVMSMLFGHARQRLLHLTHQFVIFRGVARSLVSFLPTLRRLPFGHTVFDSGNLKTNQVQSNEKRLQCLLNTNPVESMFAARLQAITDAIGNVWPFEALRVVALLSKPGCKQQQFHHDFDPAHKDDGKGTFSGIIALQTETRVVFGCGPVVLNAGDVCLFERDTVHAGAGYMTENVRLHLSGLCGYDQKTAVYNETFPAVVV
jgi:hypothetical protein